MFLCVQINVNGTQASLLSVECSPPLLCRKLIIKVGDGMSRKRKNTMTSEREMNEEQRKGGRKEEHRKARLEGSVNKSDEREGWRM